MSSTPLFRFGVVADPQYADLEPNLTLNRYPANSLVKLREAIEEFNRHELAFVVTLGDIIDREWKSFDAILPVYETLRHPKHFLLGNHDFAVAPEHLQAVHEHVPIAHDLVQVDAVRAALPAERGAELPELLDARGCLGRIEFHSGALLRRGHPYAFLPRDAIRPSGEDDDS